MPHAVLIVEDDERMRERLAAAVAANAELVLTGAVGSLAAARERIADRYPDVLLVDLGLPDGDGTELLRELRRAGAPTRSMVITVFGDERHVIAALSEGASGYLLKDASAEDVGRAILDVLSGGTPLSPMVARYLLRHLQADRSAGAEDGAPALTERETEVLRLIAKGFSYEEVGELLGTSLNTVRSHIRHLYRKLGVGSRGEAVFEALGLGLIERDG